MSKEKLSIEYVGSLFGHNGIVSAITVGKDSSGKPLLISGGRDKKIIVWKLDLEKSAEPSTETDKKDGEKEVGKPFRSLTGHSHFVSGLSLSGDSKFLVSSSWDKTLRLWDLNTFKTRNLLVGHTGDVLSATFSQDGRIVLSGGMDKTLRVWNNKGEPKHVCSEFGGWVSSITHIKQEKQQFIAVGSWDSQVKIYDKDYTLLNTITDFDYGVVSTSTDDDGEFLFSAEKNGKIRVHALDGANTDLKSTIEVNADINAISFESKYFYAISVATSKGLLIHEVSKTNKVLFTENYGGCHSLAWDDSKTYLFAGFADGAIRVFKFRTE